MYKYTPVKTGEPYSRAALLAVLLDTKTLFVNTTAAAILATFGPPGIILAESSASLIIMV
jgi:hypothetical protein